MAKKNKFETDDFDLGSDLDFPDFNPGSPDKIKDNRSPLTKLGKATLSGAADRAVSPQFIRNMVKKSLPQGYGSALDMADQTAGSIRNLYNDTAKEIKPVIKDLKRTTAKVMPSVEKVIPKAISDRIKKWAATADDSYGTMSAEQQRDASLQMQLGDIFKFQTQQAAQKDAENDAKESIKTGIEHSRHRDMLGQLDAMRVSLQQLAGYQDKVTSNYQRKSLELQFRHYFVAQDALAESRSQGLLFKDALEKIVKNTGLPDFVKMNKREAIAQEMRNRFVTGVTSSLFGNRQGFAGKVIKNLGDGIKDKVMNFASNLQTGLSAAELGMDANDQMKEMGGSGIGYDIAGGMIGGGAVDGIGTKIAKKVRGWVNKSPRAVKLGNDLLFRTQNAPQLAHDWARSSKNEDNEGLFGGVKNSIVGAVKDAIRGSMYESNALSEGSTDTAGSMRDPTVFNRGASKAITEIIPGYLARIYRELSIMRTGDANTKLISYDYTNNTFADPSARKRNMFNSIVKDQDREYTKTQVNDLINKVDPDGTKLTAEQRRLLGGQMLRDNIVHNSAGSKERLTSVNTYEGEAGKHAAKFRDLFAEYFAGDNGEKQRTFARDFSQLGAYVGDPRSKIQDHVNTGGRPILEELGLLTPGSDQINMARLYEYMFEDGSKPGSAPVTPNRKSKATNAKRKMRTPVGADPVPHPSVEPIVSAPPTAHAQLDGDLSKAIWDASAKNETITVNETLLRIEARINKGFGGGGGGYGGEGNPKPSWWNKSLKEHKDALFGQGKKLYDYTFDGKPGIFTKGWDKTKELFGQAKAKVQEWNDIYIKGDVQPRLLAWKLKAEMYRDEATNNIIKSLKDLKGNVIDENGNVVLRKEELGAAMMRSKLGVKLLSAYGVAVEYGTKAKNALLDALPPAYAFGNRMLQKAYSTLLDRPVDIYVKDKYDVPVILAKVMEAGGYFNRINPKVAITKPSQIAGAVLNDLGNEVLTEAEFALGLYDIRGNKLSFGFSKLGHLANVAVGHVVNNAIKGIELAKKVGHRLWTGAKDVAGSLTNGIGFGVGFDTKTSRTVIDRLTEIRDILKNGLPGRRKHVIGDSDGDGVRDGSYEDIEAKEKAAKAAAAGGGSGPTDPSKPGGAPGASMGGMLGGAFSGIKGAYNRLRGKKVDEDGNAIGGGDINIGGFGNSAKAAGTVAGEAGQVAKVAGNASKTAKVLGAAKGVGRGLWGATKLGMGLMGLGEVAGVLGTAGTVAGAVGSGALAVGGAAVSGIGAAAGVIGTGLAAIGSVLSAPVILGALAVAGVAYGGYKLYKYMTRKQLTSLSKVRYVQYGFIPTDLDHFKTVFELEDALMPGVNYDGGQASIDDKKVDLKKLSEMFGVALEDKANMDKWLTWFAVRFKPVFLTHLSALNKVDPKADLAGIERMLPKERSDYLTIAKFPGGPYSVMVAPFPDQPTLVAGEQEVNNQVALAQADIAAEVAELERSGPKGDGAAKPGAAAAGAAVVGGAAVAGGAAAGTPGAGVTDATAKPGGPSDGTQKVGAAVAGGAVVTVAGTPMDTSLFSVNKVDALSAVRYKTYGLVDAELPKVRALSALENKVNKDISYGKGDTANWSGSVETLMQSMGPGFGIEGIANNEGYAWISWFNLRFLPTYLNYLTAVMVSTGKKDITIGLTTLSAQGRVDVATAIKTTLSKYDGSPLSVWQIPASPWPGYVLNADAKSVDINMSALLDQAKTSILTQEQGRAEPKKDDKTPANPMGDAGAKAAAGNAALTVAAKSDGGGFFSNVGNKIASAYQGVKNFVVDTYTKMSGQGEFPQPGNGTGGNINAIPKPTGNSSWQALKDTILGAAKMVGVDPSLMSSIAAVESGFDYTVGNKGGTSTAKGLYQFVDKTWADMLGRNTAKYGIDPNTPPTDPRANALLGAEYVKFNYKEMKRLGVTKPLSATDLYMGHFLGAGGAAKFLKILATNPETIGATAMPTEAAANDGVFYERGTHRALSVGEIYANMQRKIVTANQRFKVDLPGASATDPSPVTPGASGAPSGTDPSTVAANAATAAPGAATAPSSDTAAVAPAKATNPIGVPVSDTGPGVATTKTPVAPMVAANAAALPSPAAPDPVALAGQGFTTPRSRDLAAQADYQKDVSAKQMGDLSDVMQTSNTIQQSQLDVLRNILDMMGKGRDTPRDTKVAANDSNMKFKDNRPRPMPAAPVSMDRPDW